MGLVGATVTHVTSRCWNQLVDIVGAAVLHINVDRFLAANIKLVKADLSCDYTLSHCRMSTIQPAWEVCITSALRWTCGRHLRPCGSIKTIPANKKGIVTLIRPYRCVVVFSFCIRQSLVVLTIIS